MLKVEFNARLENSRGRSTPLTEVVEFNNGVTGKDIQEKYEKWVLEKAFNGWYLIGSDGKFYGMEDLDKMTVDEKSVKVFHGKMRKNVGSKSRWK